MTFHGLTQITFPYLFIDDFFNRLLATNEIWKSFPCTYPFRLILDCVHRSILFYRLFWGLLSFCLGGWFCEFVWFGSDAYER